MRRIFIFLVTAILLTSCITLRNGNVSSSAPTSARIVDIAVGVSKNFAFLGLGGNYQDAMILDAKRNMYSNYILPEGHAFANYTVDFKTTYYLVFKKLKVVVSADVIALENQDLKMIPFEVRKGSEHALSLGDSLLLKKNKFHHHARIIDFDRNGRVLTAHRDGGDNYKVGSLSYKKAMEAKTKFLKFNHLDSVSSGANISFRQLSAPTDAKGPIVRFLLDGEIYEGELVEKGILSSTVHCIDITGKRIGIMVTSESIIEELTRKITAMTMTYKCTKGARWAPFLL